ncbi:hypothetical protein BLO02_026435 [Bacillus cereus]|nr:hypothetical protein BLO02_026435 [Bacillus cereus]
MPIPALFSETYRKRKKGHTNGICMRRCVLLQDRFRSILILLSYYKTVVVKVGLILTFIYTIC